MWSPATLLVTGLFMALPQARPDTLILKTGSPVGSYLTAGEAIAQLLEDSIPGLEVLVQTSSGSVQNVLALGRGAADLAIAQSDVASHGVRGEAMFEVHGPQELAAIMGLHPEDVLVIAGRSMDAPTVSLLDPGVRVVVGKEGSGTLDNARDVLDALGYSLQDVDTIMSDPRASLPLLGTDSAQIVFLTGGVDDGFWETVARMEARPLSMGDELVQLLQRERRYYRATAFEFGGETIHTVRVRAVLLARSGLPDDLAETITRLVHRGLPEIRTSNEWARQVLPRTVREYVPLRWHPGANRYYCQEGLGGCQPVVSYLLLLLALIGLAFVALRFSSTLRAGLRRAAPRLAEKLVGPHGVTDRYRYLVIPVLVSIIILGGAFLIQVAEVRYANSNNVTTEFEGRSLQDNLLWTIVFTTTGFEEGLFPRSPAAKIISSLLGLVGIGGVILLVGLVTSDQLARKMKMQMSIDPRTLEGHVILCGWNSRAAEIISKLTDPELEDRRQMVVVVADLGFDPVEEYDLPRDHAVLMKGSPTDLDHMRKAGLDTADTVIVLADETVDDPDSQTVLTVLQAEKHAHRQMTEGVRKHELRSVAELVDPQKKPALESVHTDLILCPQEFSEKILLQALLNPGVTQFLGDVLSVGKENQVVEVPVHGVEDPPLVGKTFDEAMVLCREKALLLLSIHRGGAPGVEREVGTGDEWGPDGQVVLDAAPTRQLLTNPHTSPDREYRIQAGDSLLFLAHSHEPLAEIFGSPKRWNRAFQG